MKHSFSSVVRTFRYSLDYLQTMLLHWDGRSYADAGSGVRFGSRAILLVPGLLGTVSVMERMSHHFCSRGFPVFVMGMGLLSVVGEGVMRKRFSIMVERVRHMHPQFRRVDVIAHSMGGRVALAAIEDGVFDGMEVRLVALGSPFQGTSAAAIAAPISGAAFQMLPPFSRLTLVRVSEPFPFISIAGAYDVISPPESCIHPDATNLVVDADHAGLIFREDVFEHVEAFLYGSR